MACRRSYHKYDCTGKQCGYRVEETNPQLPDGSIIINVCAGCDRRFRNLYDGISTISLWEIIDKLNNFPFPDYHGMEVSVHDPCPVRNIPVVHMAVRELLQKMNINVIEAEKNGTNSVCCGDSLYPDCDIKKIHTAMKNRAGPPADLKSR